MGGRVGTWVLTTALALLVWIWAEGESLSEERVTTQIELVDGASAETIATDANWRSAVMVRMRGSTGSLAAARKELLRAPLRLEPGVGAMPAADGDATLDMRSVVREHPEVRRLGVAIVEVEPQFMRVRVRRK